MPKKLKIEEIKRIFLDNDCELLSTEYINANKKLKYKCKCGVIGYTFLISMKRKRHCRKCGALKMKKTVTDKYDFDEIKKYYEDSGCKLLESHFKNTKTKMRYLCSCGGVSLSSYECFRRGHRCKKCAYKKIGESQKPTIDYVRAKFKELGADLLETKYIDCKTKMKYRCKCGDINYTIFDTIKNRPGLCRKCGFKKYTGDNHPRWNPNLTDEDREKNATRHSDPLYIKWRKRVFKRDDYTCRCCNIKGGKMNAHHLQSWVNHKSLRLIVDNGVTMCEKCHIDFHQSYGYGGNTKKQFKDYKERSK